MHRLLYLLTAFLSLCLLAATPVMAAVDTLYCDADATIGGEGRLLVPGGGRQGYLCVGRVNINPINSNHQAYLRFDLNGIDPAAVTRAELLLWKSRDRRDTLHVYGVDDDGWDEYGLHWGNRPVDGELLGSVYVQSGRYNAVEATGHVRAQTDDGAGFNLQVNATWTPDDTYLGFNSREGGRPPLLVVTHDGPSRADTMPRPGFPSTSSLEHGVYIDDGVGMTEYGSIAEAIDAVRPGQEIVLGPGVYYESFDLTPDGTDGAPLKIRGDGDPRPIIDGSLNSTEWENTDRGLIKVSGDHWTVEHLEVRNAHPWAEAAANSGGFYIYPGDNCTIRDCAVYYNGNGIFCTESSADLTLEYNEVAWNSFPGAGFEHGHYVNGAGTTTVRFCHIHDNGGQNFKCRAEDLVFSYNYLHSCGNYQVDLPEGKDFIDQDAVLTGNVVVVDNPNRTNEQFLVFGQNRRGGSLFLYNNTFIQLHPGGSSFVHLWYPGDTPVGNTTFEAWNNVFYKPPESEELHLLDADKPTPVKGGNNWVSAGLNTVPEELAATLEGVDPGLRDIVGGDYRPAAGSPLVDAGTGDADALPEFHYVHPRSREPRPVSGAAVDIGAYERLSRGEAYDFNRDGELGLSDLMALIADLIHSRAAANADINGDGRLTAADALALLVYLRTAT